MVFAVEGCSGRFYVIGLNYWLLVGAFVGLIEIVPIIGPIIGSILVLAVGLPQSPLHVAGLALLWLVVVREFQNYVVNPRIGQTVGLSPLVTLLSVAVVGVLFGGRGRPRSAVHLGSRDARRRPRARSRPTDRTTAPVAPARSVRHSALGSSRPASKPPSR